MKAQAALRGANLFGSTGKVTLEGTTAYIPGNTININGFGKYDNGVYRIQTATHTLSRSRGYITELDLLQVPQATP
jgi:uncharacterized protein